ncbi:MAG: hypothetical protein P8Y70_04265, partial [Candidatus Lokiarchaeota archaeon]
EMKSMFRNIIIPVLKEKKGKFYQKGFKLSGIGESQIAPHVTELEEKYPDLWIKTHPRLGLAVEVEISITCFDKAECEKMIDEVLEKLKNKVIYLGGKIKEEKVDYS